MTKQEAEAFLARCANPDAVLKMMKGLEDDGILDKLDWFMHADAGEMIDLVAMYRALQGTDTS